MTTAHWMAIAGWVLAGLFARVAWAGVQQTGRCLQGWDECQRLLEAANAMRKADRDEHRDELKRREWACLALLARQHRDGKHDGKDFRTCARCREVAAEVGAGKA